MTTNRDWLFSLPLDEQIVWMNAEHQDGTLGGDTAALNAKIAELERKLRISWEYECKFQDERDTLQGALDIAVQNESKLEAERDNLAADLERCEKERERYRDLFGKCLDYADAIHALMDEGMA